MPKVSLTGVWSYVTAEAVFFTHGLYGVPRTVGRKPTYNLWHGEGMKRSRNMFPTRRAGGLPSDYLVGMTALYSSLAAERHGLPSEQILLSGYPRNDELFRPCGYKQLEGLGVDPDAPFVVWMPSFRQAASKRAEDAWSDTEDSEMDEELASILAAGARTMIDAGVQLLVKPHPTDAVARSVPGARLIDDAQLKAVGASLYSVLGRSAGLITDVSSVGTDYLLLDRPIGYFFPDRDQYIRGLWPADVLEHLAGPDLVTAGDFAAFADEVRGISSAHMTAREAARSWMGMVETRRAGRDLLDLVSSQGKSRFARSIDCGRNRVEL